jgi:predicted dithiol-disulfide oxidoreductase (DUF899 family)
MPDRRIVSHEEWDGVRAALLEREKELTHMSDDIARQRHELPWVRIEKPYTFQTADGARTLAELFDGRSQLAIYHFMFGPDWDAGCPVCSSIADSFDGVIPHLAARDVTMIAVSRAPIEKLLAFRQRMGWNFNWASSYDTDFNWDWGHSSTREKVREWADQAPAGIDQFASASGTDRIGYITEGPGLTVFTTEGDEVYLAYEGSARSLEVIMTYYGVLDRVPRGRDDGESPDPFWIRHHDSYGT